MSLFSADNLASAPVRSVLNPGKYHMRITGAKSVLSSQAKTPGIELKFDVVQGPIQENGSDPTGRKCTQTLYSSQDPAKREPFYSRMHALANATDFDLGAYSGMSEDEFTEAFVGSLITKELVVTIANEDYKGEPRESLKGFAHL